MAKQKSNPLFISVSQAHREYGFSEASWWKLIKAGKIKRFRPSGVRVTLLYRRDIIAYLSGEGVTGDTRNKKRRSWDSKKDVATLPMSAISKDTLK